MFTSMAHGSDIRFLVLHGLKLKGFAEAEALSSCIGVKAAAVTSALNALQAEGLVIHRDGRISGFALTSSGRVAHNELLAADVQASGQQALLHSNYESFLPLNAELLAVCTAWQVVDIENNVLNDHADAAYDQGVISRLGMINQRVLPITAALESGLSRFGCYQARFDVSLVRVQAGEREYFAKPIIDSFHTVWMELHEDLLKSLNIDRASENP
jgi:hypothetical protein